MKLHGVGVVGLGYVGLPLAKLIHTSGNDVTGIENNAQRITDLKLTEQFHISNSVEDLVDKKIIIICVPTPVHRDNTPDLTILNSVLESLSPHLQTGQLVIIESTVYPGYCRNIAIKKLESKSSLHVGTELMLAHCPERINPGDKKWSIATIPRVLGGYDKKSTDTAVKFYESILKSNVHIMNTIEEAEAVKVVENTFRDINIAYVNELAITFNKIGIDIVNVIDGAATKPFGFLAHYPSIGVGGHCIPVDPYYLIDTGKSVGIQNKFIAMARSINNGMPSYLAAKLEDSLLRRGMHSARITVLGVAYKANINDIRESPVIEFIKILKDNGHAVTVYDPHVPHMSTVETLNQALANCEVVVVATHHTEFNLLEYTQMAKKGTMIVVDGHDTLNQAIIETAGLEYIGVGRISS